MRVVVIHMDHRLAAETGLFGTSGEGFVQVVEASDTKRINDLWTLARSAEKCKIFQSGTHQNLDRRHLAWMKAWLDQAIRKYDSEDLAETMCPAIISRLCAQMCNSQSEGPDVGTRSSRGE
jgi:hypothetical protein